MAEDMHICTYYSKDSTSGFEAFFNNGDGGDGG